jgi:polysaccharide export outer membrane protein
MTKQNSWKYHLTVKAVIVIALGGLLLNGCVTSKKTTYLQLYEESNYSQFYEPPEDYQIQMGDNIYLNVRTPDPTRSAMFNAMGEGVMGFDEATAQIYSYNVQIDGTVELPYIGPVDVAGKTLKEAKEIIAAELSEYVNDATITVKLVNNNVTVLGEVVNPGVYQLNKDRLNVFQALALAGDIDDYGDRYSVSIIRKSSEGEGTVVKEFNITDRNIIDTEFYYIHPNDVIYVKPMKGKFFGMATFPFTLIFTGITTFILIDNYLQQ